MLLIPGAFVLTVVTVLFKNHYSTVRNYRCQ